jgi:hypothetical protein
MAIYRLLQNSPLGPEEIKRMTDAYEHALQVLQLSRSDPITESVAATIVAITQTGQRDPLVIATQAIKVLGIPIKE